MARIRTSRDVRRTPTATDPTPAAIPPSTAPGQQWYTVAQLCERWQLSRKTVYKYIAAGLLPAWRIGAHLYRVAVTDVVKFESEQKIRPNRG